MTDSQARARKLRDALGQYRRSSSNVYDEVVVEVSARAAAASSLGKADIGALVVWKRLNASTRWAASLMATPDKGVRAATGNAFDAAQQIDASVSDAAQAARSALAKLPGFTTGDALASAVIYALAPDRMAVYDRRAQAGLELLGLSLSAQPGRYGRYMELVEQLRVESGGEGATAMSAREVDLALFTLGGRHPS